MTATKRTTKTKQTLDDRIAEKERALASRKKKGDMRKPTSRTRRVGEATVQKERTQT